MSRVQGIELYKTRSPLAARRLLQFLPLCLLPFLVAPASGTLQAQDSAPVSKPDAKHLAEIEERLNDLTKTLTETQIALRQSLVEVQELRSELEGVRQSSASKTATEPAVADAHVQTESSSMQADLEALHEQQEILQAEIKQHDQTKLETESKYRLKVTGVALFNAFSNAGVVDNVELPALALLRVPGGSHGSTGATLRQTVLGIAATGPAIAGAQSSASVHVDFFGGTTTNAFGYSAAGGDVRMRDAALDLDWDKSTVEVGYSVPLISPLSPTSYASVAAPSLAGSGNLWTWSPQVRFEQRVPLGTARFVSLEAGLIYPSSPNYNAIQADSPVEASRRPGVEGRVAYHGDRRTAASPHSLVLGVGAYRATQFYNSARRIHSWAVTGDWQVPLSRRFDLSGEVYRGRALGGLGGGLYKDVLTGTDYNTGLGRTVGVETAGGWSQLKLILNSRLEANAAFGLDDAYSSSFDGLTLPASANALTVAARNRSFTGNIIFRPRSSLILSPEYKHIISWSYQGAANSADIFSLSAGYRF